MSKQIFTKEDSLDNILPPKGWLREYVDFSSGLEACSRFRFFTACSILGAAINNKIFIQRGDIDLLPKLFPNLWVLLLAPPGRGHKTSTINMGVNCLMQGAPDVRILADKITPESLVKALSEPVGADKIRIGPCDATGLIKAPELSVFFGKQQYNVGLVSLITDLYDYRPEWSSETIARGKATLKNICLSILGGSTPEWLQKMLPEDAFEGGFMSRFVIVEMPPTYFKRVSRPKQRSHHTWEEIIQKFTLLSRMEGEIRWDVEAQKAYDDFYESLTPTGDKQRDAYQEREAEQILKLAMLLTISEGSFDLKKWHLNKAREILNHLMLETVPRIERLTTHPRMYLIPEITDLLRQHDQMTRQEIAKKVYRGLAYGESQFNEALRLLLLSEVVELTSTGGKQYYRLKGRGVKVKIKVK